MLMESIRKGAIAYLPKETLSDLDVLLKELLAAHEMGQPTRRLLFDKPGDYFDKRFVAGWKEKDKKFRSEFSRTYHVGKGIVFLSCPFPLPDLPEATRPV